VEDFLGIFFVHGAQSDNHELEISWTRGRGRSSVTGLDDTGAAKVGLMYVHGSLT
jgi:hypothetical protein